MKTIFKFFAAAGLVTTAVDANLRAVPAPRHLQSVIGWPRAFVISFGDWCMTAKHGVLPLSNGDDPQLGMDKCDFDNVSS